MLPTEKIYGIQSSHIFMKIRKDSCGWLWAVYEWAIYHATIIIQNKLYDTQYTMYLNGSEAPLLCSTQIYNLRQGLSFSK